MRGNEKNVVSATVFLILALTYWTSIPAGVSFWDCPEYLTGAMLLSPGHPPGNPLWLLIERVATMFSSTAIGAATVVNMSSGLFTALAAMLMARSLFDALNWILRRGRKGKDSRSLAAGGALVGALCFGWCDSAWYSAVEAEVYALSILLTSLSVKIMVSYAFCRDERKSVRLLVLSSYIIGLSIGAHQLNLLAIPALALIFVLKKKKGCLPIRLTFGALLLSLGAIICILFGMMTGSLRFAGVFEIICVNYLGLPFLSGVWLYAGILLVSSILAIYATSSSTSRIIIFLSFLPVLFLSGLFLFDGNYLLCAFIAAAVSLLVSSQVRRGMTLFTLAWMIAVLPVGYSVYGVILFRGDVPSAANALRPSDPFSLISYLNRDQYGSTPLFYGRTPYSKPLYNEIIDPATGKYSYPTLHLSKGERIIRPYLENSLSRGRTPLTEKDSLFNAKSIGSGRRGYVVTGYKETPVYTPELDMWFPRITSSRPSDLQAFSDWTGMDKESMEKVRISEALDSLGNPVSKVGSDGKRIESYSYRPTYMQNLRMFLTYQAGYMYFRYLLWNFSGRQNDYSSSGEVDDGNFITGILPLDNLMLGAEDALPPEAGKENKGHNSLYMLPLLLGIAGIVWLIRRGRRGQGVCTVIAALFLLTGVAIAFYLNQSPGEARERDYSFLGSFMAWAAWTGCGAVWLALSLARLNRKLFQRTLYLLCFVPSLAIAGWMFFVNHDDHDRSGRSAAFDIASNSLNSLDKDAILFVDGDNFTFPLWYAQEGAGLRRDVSVINISYLALPRYVASLSAGDNITASPLMTAPEERIVYGAFSSVPFRNVLSSDTIEAVDFLRNLYAMDKPIITHRYIRIGRNENNGMIVDLSDVARHDGFRPLMFRRLAILDIIATNASSPNPRPVYWQRSLSPAKTYPFGDRIYPELIHNRLDSVIPDESVISKACYLVAPNNGDGNVYLDETPRTNINAQRIGIVTAADRMLSRGNASDALELALTAYHKYGPGFPEYGVYGEKDTAYNVAVRLGSIMIEAGRIVGDSTATVKGKEILHKEELRKERWRMYRKAMPPRLRDKIYHH